MRLLGALVFQRLGPPTGLSFGEGMYNTWSLVFAQPPIDFPSNPSMLAVDLPHMEPGWFAARAADCAPGVGVVGRRDGFFEPLAAIYPRTLAPLAREMIEARVLSLQKLLAAGVSAGRLRVHEITPDEQAMFANWNEPGRA